MKTKVNYLKHLVYISIVGLMTLSFTGCEKNLDVGLPNSQLTGSNVFKEVSTTRAALSQVYADIRDNPPFIGTLNGVNILLGLYADELKYYGERGLSVETFYIHNIHANNFLTEGFWSGAYQIIYECNAILEGLETSPLTEEEKAPLKGEALFLRAFLNFYLTNLYGDIPYITTTDYRMNTKVKRKPQEEVYVAMIADLRQAKQLLSKTNLVRKNIYATKGAVNTLLARIYLYHHEWQKSAEAATSVLESVSYTWPDDLSQVFTTNGTGVIWQLPPVKGTITKEAMTFIFETGPPPTVALQAEFVESFEPADARATQWIGSVTEGDQNWYYPYKYKTRIAGNGPEEFSVLMRLAEVVLIRAEARAHLGDIAGAQSDLNQVRQRAGLANTQANTKNELVTAILHERRHELFTEQGHRWFDLKRTELAASVLQPIKPNWKNTDRLFPVPQRELKLNPNLEPQNPGY